MEFGNMIFSNSPGGYKVHRDEWQDKFAELLNYYELNYHGRAYTNSYPLDNPVTYNSQTGGIKTKLFEINPYDFGNGDNVEHLPNFKYYPTGCELYWYKYPLRDVYSNHDITFEQFCDMINKCMEIKWKY